MRAQKQLISAEVQSIVQPTVFSQTIANYLATEAVNLQHVPLKDDEKANQKKISGKDARVNTQSAQVFQGLDEVHVDNNEFYIYTIVSHKLNRNKRYASDEDSDTLYLVRWVGYDSKDDTWEPLPNLTRSHVI